jgi:hypothetical protein
VNHVAHSALTRAVRLADLLSDLLCLTVCLIQLAEDNLSTCNNRSSALRVQRGVPIDAAQ